MKKRVCALLLTACIVFGLALHFPMTAAAAEIKLPSATVTKLNTSIPVTGVTVADLLDGKVDLGGFMGGTLTEGLSTWPLTFALRFQADYASEEQLEKYGDWQADFELMVTEDVCGTDGYLAGQYTNFSPYWVIVEDPSYTEPVIHAGEPVRVMEFAGLPQTYNQIYSGVGTFNCGLFLNDAFWRAHPNAKVWLSLKIYDPNNQNAQGITIGYPHVFVSPYANEGTEAPETGDTTNTLLWTTLLMGGVAMLWMQLNDRKREMI